MTIHIVQPYGKNQFLAPFLFLEQVKADRCFLELMEKAAGRSFDNTEDAADYAEKFFGEGMANTYIVFDDMIVHEDDRPLENVGVFYVVYSEIGGEPDEHKVFTDKNRAQAFFSEILAAAENKASSKQFRLAESFLKK